MKESFKSRLNIMCQARNRGRIVPLIIFLITPFLPSFAQPSITAESKVDRDQVLIGDVIVYSIVTTFDSGLEVQLPSPGANLGMFEIRSYKLNEPQKQNGKIVESAMFHISTFETGEFEIPRMDIVFRTKGDSGWSTIQTEPILIKVASLNPDEAGDIRDIKPPLTPPYNYRRLFLLIFAGLLTAGLVVLAAVFIKRRREGKSLIPRRVKPPKPAHEIALAELEELVHSDLLSTGQVKEYYSSLADIIRRYIGNRYFIYAMEMTSGQLLDSIRREGLDMQLINVLSPFLTRCDWVKFAKYLPAVEEHQETTDIAFQFVHQTKLMLVEEYVAEPASAPPKEELQFSTVNDQGNSKEEKRV
ncbi:MAG: hypothetical protein EHM72_03605 [Calditrichaeota bacterium]|nr:MAG: hypothetical protein EHM72_03605 [Calditrichota bacterium]